MNKKVNINSLIILVSLFLLVIVGIIILYRDIHGVEKDLKIKLNGPKKIVLDYGKEYKEKGAKAYYKKKNISNKIVIYNKKFNIKKIGKYKIVYKVKYKHVFKTVERIVEIVDKEKPVINLKDGEITIYVGSEFQDPLYEAKDNYDGDLTDKVKVTNNVDTKKIGEYEVIYEVEDSSGNKETVKRKVTVTEKKIVKNSNEQKIAVLNYHFFYDEGENCNENICERTSDFRSHLDYLKNNGFKTLTIKEFRDWMYGKIELPEKSVLITIDDGAMGTGKHNGNKLIPILEEYKMHATLFLITGWWDINNYKSEYLDIESHTHDMHNSMICADGSKKAQILCMSNEQILNDLKTSISVVKSTKAFCFPFYTYNENAINLVKEAGFEMAFIGGNRKAKRSDDKWHIPRYPVHKDMSLETIISYVN